MLKKLVAFLTALALLLPCVTAFAVAPGEARVAIGANLTEAQKAEMYTHFGLEQGTVEELSITNAEERAYLSGLVDESLIGTRSISCVAIVTLDEGAGLQISTHNITWCSKEMYQNALLTAGITDARVMISAPVAVSGTAALAGIYKAYEDLTGELLNSLAKDVGVQELITTGELAEYLGGTDAATLVSELKKVLAETKGMTDEQIRKEIMAIAKNLNISVNESQIDQLLSLCRSLEGLSDTELTEKVQSVTAKLKGLSQAGQKVTEFVESAKGFIASVGKFFSGLFGGKK